VALDSSDPNYGLVPDLPLVITEAYTVGEIIPAGFLLVKNWTTGEVYDEAEYTYNGSNSVLIGNVDITTEADRGDEFVIITVGTDITTSIDDLRRKSRHSHDRTFGEPLVPAASIGDWTAGPWGSRGSFTVSAIEGNPAPQYLHRYGYQSGENSWNDKNIMRGHLVVGKTSSAEGEYFDSSTGFSYSLYFGDTSGVRLYAQSTNGYFLTPGSMNLEAGGGIDIEASGGDVTLQSTGGDVEIRGGLEVLHFAGDPYVSAADHMNNAAIYVAPVAGNIDAGYSGVGADSMLAGPVSSYYSNDLPIWAIDENGSTNGSSSGTGSNHYATTQIENTTVGNSGWVVPAFQVLHYAQWNVDFEPFDNDDQGSPNWNAVTHWAASISLPNYLQQEFANNLGANAVLGYTIMVKSSSVNTRWHTLGGSSRWGGTTSGDEGGERVNSYMDIDTGTASNNKIRIIIAADGYDGRRGSGSGQNFHVDRFQGGAGAGDPASSIEVDVKIVLIVAAPTDSISGIAAVRP
jgi:hypothetical protein